jgi:chromosome partitioning protein
MPAIIAFVSQKGGVGKSTLARALAAVCAHAGSNVVLADLDPAQQTLVHWQEARAQNEVSPAVAVTAFGDAVEAIERAAECDILILDMPGGTNEATLEAARSAHFIVQPTGPGLDDLHPAVLLFHELTSAGIPKKRLVAALCRVLDSAEEEAARIYIEAAGYEVLPGSIPESVNYRIAHNRGRSLIETEEKNFNERADALIEALLIKAADIMQPAGDAATESRRKGDAV